MIKDIFFCFYFNKNEFYLLLITYYLLLITYYLLLITYLLFLCCGWFLNEINAKK
ncbi:IS602 orfA (plasmid) [Escherichia coli O145:H28 str. RM12761]|nr:IS602 orfA [Escherichia coli O145:H28 str. RM13516]AHY68530.1 IS602 orfA [Escherichia coli O145:H28 str. RM12761]